MIMHKIKLLAVTVLGIASLALPLAAQADIKIYNHSPVPSTTRVDGGQCSFPSLGAQGITGANSENTIYRKAIVMACIVSSTRKQSCHADVYMSGDCSGEVVSTIWLTKDQSAIERIEPKSNAYTLASSYREGMVTVDIYKN